jgi:HemY protein
LIDFWNEAPRHIKDIPRVTEKYARLLISVMAAGEAESVLRHYLDKNWHESTIILYSELDVMVDNSQLEAAEAWLEDHQQNAWLLLALGKMCISRSLWGKARNYLEASISIRPMPENYLKLARLLEEHMDEPAAAQEYYRQGLHLLAGDYGEDVLSKDFERETPQLKVVKT